MARDARLAAISRCCAELERIRGTWEKYPDERQGIQLAECDWMAELHHLLYGESH